MTLIIKYDIGHVGGKTYAEIPIFAIITSKIVIFFEEINPYLTPNRIFLWMSYGVDKS